MRLYWELARLSFQRQLTYRTANLAGIVTNLFFGMLRAAVMVALYGAQTTVSGMSLLDAITFTGLSQALIAFLSLFSWYDMMNNVYSGDVASDLLKPLNLFVYWLAQDLGRAWASLLMRGLPIVLVYALVFHIPYPTHPTQWLALFATLLLGGLISFTWRFLVNLASFWTPNAMGIARFGFGLSWFLSGFIMPLRFFPEVVQRIIALTPFPTLVNTSVEVYLGLLTGPALLQALAVQLVWFVVLAGICQIVLRAGVRSLVIQGG
jgi:ABC-2 type transport system permease protein